MTQDDVEAWWRELDPQQQQLAIYSELRQIRALLSEPNETDARDSHEVFKCTKCEWEGSKEDREMHARKAHKAPGDMIDELFEVKE